MLTVQEIYQNNSFLQEVIENISVNPLLSYKIGSSNALMYAMLLQLDKLYDKCGKLNSNGEFVCSYGKINKLSGLKRGAIQTSIKCLTELHLIECRVDSTNKSNVKTTHFKINRDSVVLDNLISEAYKELTGYEAIRLKRRNISDDF